MRISAPILMIGLLGFAALAAGYLLTAAPKTDEDTEQDASVAHVWNSVLAEVPLEDFERIQAGPLNFPQDYGAHPKAPMETLNLSAHLRGENGERFGVQISLSRLALVGPDAAPATSKWEMHEFYRGHTILVGDEGALAEERLRRGFAGLAGYDAQAREWRLDDWSMKIDGDSVGPGLVVAATIGEGAGLELRLEPEKEPVSPDGESTAGPFRGYSMTRLSAKGVLVTKDGLEAVEGVAWLDHAWGNLPVPTGPTVWDRLLLHVDDGSDISLIRTRRRDGSGTPTVEGFIVDPKGDVSQIEGPTVEMEPLQTWSPDGASSAYPVSWRLSLGSDKEVVVSPVVDDQLHEFVVPVWSGAVTARGNLGSGPVEAFGTMQLNGYSEP